MSGADGRAMRFIHTADWHLGRLFHGVHLTEDQRFALQGLLRLARERQVDAVVIAGDVFDRGVPPTEAVDLLDEIVATLALDLHVQVVMIAGNHDSAVRLEYMSGLARRTGVHVVGRVGARPEPALVVGRDGVRVRFWPLAYTDPETARYELGRDDIHSHEAVFRGQLECLEADPAEVDANVLIAHAFVAGCRESESERALSVGGTGAVPAGLLQGFDYVALGHLHEAQPAGSESVRYSGSLLKYSFNEAEQDKAFTVVDLVPGRPPALELVPVVPRRDVRRVRGRFEELMGAADAALSTAKDCYVEAVLTDTEPVLDPVQRLRQVFPYLLSLRRESQMGPVAGPSGGGTVIQTRSTFELFGEFFFDVKATELSGAQREVLAAVLTDIERERREGVGA